MASDLRIVPCCIIGNPDVSEVGNAKGGFSQAWYGETMRDFREAHLRGDIPKVCVSCYETRKQQAEPAGAKKQPATAG